MLPVPTSVSLLLLSLGEASGAAGRMLSSAETGCRCGDSAPWLGGF